MIEMYHQFLKVLFMDGTYKVNKYGSPLYQVMVQHNLGRVEQSFMPLCVIKVLSHWTKWLKSLKPQWLTPQRP